MNTSQELSEVWHFLEQQEVRLIELDRRFRALLEVLKSDARLFDSYQTTYQQLGQSSIIIEHSRSLQAIDEKLRQLGISV